MCYAHAFRSCEECAPELQEVQGGMQRQQELAADVVELQPAGCVSRVLHSVEEVKGKRWAEGVNLCSFCTVGVLGCPLAKGK